MNIPLKIYVDLLRRYLKPQRWRVLGLCGLLFSGIALQLISPQVIRTFIDTVQTGGSQSALLLAAAIFIGVVLVQRGLAIATTYVSQTVAWTATNGLRADVARHVLRLDMGFHNAHTPGELLERIDGDIDRLANFFSEFVLQILSGVLLAIGILILLYFEDWRIALILGVFVLIYLIVHTRGQQMAAPQWRLEREYVAETLGFVEERVAGIQDIQTSGATAYTMQCYYEIYRRRLWQALKADVYTDLAWTVSKTLYDVGTVVGMGMGAYLFFQNRITLGTVYLIVHYLSTLNQPLNRIARQLEDLQRIRVSIERTKTLLDTPVKIEDGPGIVLPTGALPLTFDDVSFAYNAEKTVLRHITFDLPAGQVLGLLGRTGSGKTTLSRLIFRFYDADTGQIMLNGINIRQPQVADLRQHIGIVTQDVQLFQASLRDNLTLFNDAISDARILDSLRTLGLEPWYQTLSDGLDTVLAADGQGLSAGEAQLLALTRVFLKDPGLVILDEASSRLDPATEQLLEQAIDRLLRGRTAIIIAHRLATVQRADHILILEGGQIKESGSYQALVTRPDSIFARLLKTGLTEVLI